MTVDTTVIISKTVENFSLRLGPEWRLIRRIWPNLWPVAMTPVQVQSVLDTTLERARAATPEGGILRVLAYDVRIQPETFVARGIGVLRRARYVVVSVKDSGAGLSPAMLEALFDVGVSETAPEADWFQRLAQVRDTLLRSGGGFTIEAAPGKGTRCNLYLPVNG